MGSHYSLVLVVLAEISHAQARVAVGEDGKLQNKNAFSSVTFYSEDTHYSHIEAMQVVDIPSFYQVGNDLYPDENPSTESRESSGLIKFHQKMAPALDPGSIDVEALVKLVDVFFTEKGRPIYIILNYGSTFKGSYAWMMSKLWGRN